MVKCRQCNKPVESEEFCSEECQNKWEKQWACPQCGSNNIDGTEDCTMDGLSTEWDYAMWCYGCGHGWKMNKA